MNLNTVRTKINYITELPVIKNQESPVDLINKITSWFHDFFDKKEKNESNVYAIDQVKLLPERRVRNPSLIAEVDDSKITTNFSPGNGKKLESFSEGNSTEIYDIPEMPLPEDVLRIIFQNLKSDLPSVALVCRDWKEIVDANDFRDMIHPIEAFGSREWKEYIGVDAGEHPRLPRRVYGDLEKASYMLTFIPEKVTLFDDEVYLDNLEFIGKLVENPKKGNKMSCHDFCTKRVRANHEKPHWVMINKNVFRWLQTTEVLDKLHVNEVITKENAKVPGANVSGLIDTAISLLMESIRFGTFRWPEIIDDSPLWNKELAVRVKEQIKNNNIYLNVIPGHSGMLNVQAVPEDDRIAIAIARKSF